MGLDQYLFRKRKDDRRKELGTEVCYWRKANQIRQWFVNNTSYPEDANCEKHLVTLEQLSQLLTDCEDVLAHRDMAEDILPTSEGFFFGGLDYDDSYYSDIEYTRREISKIIEETDFDKEDIYYYEWW